ncbi:MAG: glycosyltransferase family 39 protein [Gemmatimonadales bacterium]|nr:glycosyltransferase family 39 protein [Gemmatimonadales bacterium]
MLVVLVLGLLIPFLGKPFHIDDPVFLAIANQVIAHPLDPYGFDYYWFDSANRMWDLDPLNPPAMGYLLAPLIALFGEREFPLHAAFLVFPILAALSAYEIARRFTPRPFGAAALFCLAPMFIVPATTVMADLPALACLLGAVALLLVAIEGRPGAALLSGLAAAGAVLLKYTAALVIPVLAVGLLFLDPKPLRRAWSVLLPIVALLAWEAITLSQQGSSHVLEAAETSRAAGLPAREMILGAATFIFLGMGSGPVLLAARLGRREGWLALALGLPIGFGLVALYGRAHASYSGWGALSITTALAAAGGVALVALAAREALSRKAAGLFLLAWFLGGVTQVVLFGSFVAARYLLPALLPAVLLLAGRGRAGIVFGAGLAAALSLAVGFADLELARGYRDAAASLEAFHGESGRPLRFQGHWGFQHYMERQGAKPLFPEDSRALEPGEIVAIPIEGANVSLRVLALAAWDGKRVMPGREMHIEGKWPVTTMSRESGAGFYCNYEAPLPFSWGVDIVERIEVLKVIEAP